MYISKSVIERSEPHRVLLRDPGHLIAVGFGAGLMPLAPGTWGTVLAVPLLLGLSHLSVSEYLIALALIGALAIWICGRTARALNAHDDRCIVADEIVGYLVAMTAVPINWVTVCVGFVLFRFFDVVKPWPIGALDRRVPGGTGIVLDDVVAGIYAAVLMHSGIQLWEFGY